MCVTTFDRTERSEKTRHSETSFSPLFTGQNSYLLGPILYNDKLGDELNDTSRQVLRVHEDSGAERVLVAERLRMRPDLCVHAHTCVGGRGRSSVIVICFQY
jgi:hypothetical protein